MTNGTQVLEAAREQKLYAFLVSQLNKDFKRVVASHTALFKEEEAKIVKQAAKKAADSAAASAPTLGDANDALAALKKQMEKGGI